MPDPAAHVQHAVTAAPCQHLDRVVVFASAAEVVEQFPPTYGTVTELRVDDHPDGPACLLETGAADLDVLAWYLARVPGPFAVEAPDGLRERLSGLAERLAHASDPDTSPD